jgi:hypothetical protein
MEKLVNQSKIWMAALGAVAFLMVAGWQVGEPAHAQSDLIFNEIEIALDYAFAGSIDPPNQPGIHCRCHNDGVCYGGNQYSFRKLCHYSDTGSANCSNYSSNCP